MRKSILAIVATLAIASTPADAQGAADWRPAKVTLVASGLDMPVDFVISPDGASAYYVELLSGGLRRVDLASGRIDPEPLYVVPNFNTGVERGVFGLALDPDRPWGSSFYLSYSKNGSAPGSTVNVLSRWTDGKETVLYERPGNVMHNGGRVLVVGDQVFVTTGDTIPIQSWTFERSVGTAQRSDVMAGKILRLTKEGAPYPGNPWGNAAYSMGHRNVYGIAYDPATGRLFITENGSEREDEVSVIVAGKNYGWPVCQGPCASPDSRYQDPIVHWNATVGPTGATMFRGALWMAEFNHGNLHRITETSPGAWKDETAHHYAGSPPRVLDIEASPDGQSVWFCSWSELWRLDFAPDASWPVVPTPREPARPTPSTPPSTPAPTGPQLESPTESERFPLGIPGPALAAALVAFALVASARRR